jgi:hypothetical protein
MLIIPVLFQPTVCYIYTVLNYGLIFRVCTGSPALIGYRYRFNTDACLKQRSVQSANPSNRYGTRLYRYRIVGTVRNFLPVQRYHFAHKTLATRKVSMLNAALIL